MDTRILPPIPDPNLIPPTPVGFNDLEWKRVTITKLAEREEFLYRGDRHSYSIWGELKRAPTVRHKYAKISEHLIARHNLVVVYEKDGKVDGVMLLLQHASPAFTHASKDRDNPTVFNFYLWAPLQRPIAGHLPPPPKRTPEEQAAFEAEFEARQKRKLGIRDFEPVRPGIKYVCTCPGPKKHTRVIYFDQDVEPPKVCPAGSAMVEVEL